MGQVEQLDNGISELGLDVTADMQGKLIAYVELLFRWNKVYNLTAIREKDVMVSHHLLDSLAVVPFLWSGRWLDVGCGGGVPGLVLAIVRPEWNFTLLDSNTKKTGFVQQATIELGLSNVVVHSGRVENWHPNIKFDGIISRAFADLEEYLNVTKHLIAPGGRWAAMKGQPESELLKITKDFEIESVINLKVPGLQAARSLVIAKDSKGAM